MRLLVTGGAGFIGSSFVCHVLREHPDWEVTNLDRLTYAGNLENLGDVESEPRHRFIRGDITDGGRIDQLLSEGFDVIVNFAAESHVDRSIVDPSPFVETNIRGTHVLLEGARRHKTERFIQISTDEVYGSLGPEGKFTEDCAMLPNSPYAASKAAADLLCRAYCQTYTLPVIVTRCSNNFGPNQFPEKLVPLVITNALEDKEIPIYGDGLNVRDWIYVEEHCRALDLIIQRGKPGETYNIGAGNERTNSELVKYILDIMGKPQSLMRFVADRPGHDRRYALDTAKIERELGWNASTSFGDAMATTVKWYTENEAAWRRVKSGEYLDYYERTYLRR